MGYDITAYIPARPPADPERWESTDEMTEFAMLEMGTRSPDARAVFEAFDVVEFDGGVSGNAGARFFDEVAAEAALRAICTAYLEGRTTARVVRFVAQVREKFHAELRWIFVWFC